jgi:hypothetical protein
MCGAFGGWVILLSLWGQDAPAVAPRSKPDVALLLEDNGEELLPKLTNPTGCPGEGHVEKESVFSGKSCVRIVPMQRFSPGIPEWKFRITEKPKAGEYRFLRFAWKAPGCAGIMLQLHDLTDWHVRYTAGIDKYGWGTQYVADKPPAEWTLITVDLFKQFGERTIRGMALTCFDGEAGFFDHIYFGRTIDDLDRIDATGLADEPPVELTAAQVEEHWKLANQSQVTPASYRAFWTLAAAPAAVPVLAEKLRVLKATEGITTIKKWIEELDDDEFKVRETASEQLGRRLHAAKKLLEETLRTTESAEVRARIRRILNQEITETSPFAIAGKVVRVLELSRTASARQALTEFAKGDPDDPIVELAAQAIKRTQAAASP